MMFRLTPACKNYLWGGDKLRTQFGIESNLSPLAEAWVLSCHPDGPSLLPDGSALTDYLTANPASAGTRYRQFEQFPVLVKLIDAKKDLSIQVHPDDHYAMAHENQYGKTEMWIVLEAEPGAYLYYGFKRSITHEEFAAHIKNDTLPTVLNAVPVHKGDVLFIPSGTIHAICKGIVIAEIQQNSNVTYRVYDYGRTDAAGHRRALHIEQALAVTQLTPPTQHDFGPHLGQCRYFTVDYRMAPFSGVADETSFVNLLVIEGTGTLAQGEERISLAPGNSVFITAGSGAYQIQGDCTVLVTYI